MQRFRGRKMKVMLPGEEIDGPVERPIIRPSINTVAETYDLAVREEGLATAESSMAGKRTNRFLHIAESAEDPVMQNKMQRMPG